MLSMKFPMQSFVHWLRSHLDARFGNETSAGCLPKSYCETTSCGVMETEVPMACSEGSGCTLLQRHGCTNGIRCQIPAGRRCLHVTPGLSVNVWLFSQQLFLTYPQTTTLLLAVLRHSMAFEALELWARRLCLQNMPEPKERMRQAIPSCGYCKHRNLSCSYDWPITNHLESDNLGTHPRPHCQEAAAGQHLWIRYYTSTHAGSFLSRFSQVTASHEARPHHRER
jgi:hypothetical protein